MTWEQLKAMSLAQKTFRLVFWILLVRLFSYLLDVEFTWRLPVLIIFVGTISAFFDGVMVAHNNYEKDKASGA